MSKAVMDHRCPKCNIPINVQSHESVTFSPPDSPASQCNHCGVRVELELNQGDIVPCWSYKAAGDSA